ncbi:UDP-glucuronosyltransferase 2B23, partial [Trichoplax sp. H2]
MGKIWTFTGLCLLITLASLPCTQSLKVGVLPMIGGSHTLSMDLITQQIIKRGHEAVTIISNESDRLKKLKPSPLALFEIDRPATSEDFQSLLISSDPLYPVYGLYDIQTRYCDAILSNKTLLQSIQDVDIVVSDGIYFCSILLPEVLNKPNIQISFSGGIIGFHTFVGQYEPSSYIPLRITLSASGNVEKKMAFAERAANFIFGKIFFALMEYFSVSVVNKLRFKHNISTHLTLHQLRQKPSLFLTAVDFSIEYTRPLPPYIQAIGPITPKPASPLPPAFQTIMQNSTSRGVVLVSFGSELQLSDDNLPKMTAALGKLPYTVIWKTRQKIDNIPSNVNVVQWVPQNDILGHRKTIAFITHCGSNGLYEGAYHGVPMIGMPGMIEQKMNAKRLLRAGVAIYVDFNNFSEADIINAVTELVENKRYKDNAVKISKVIKSRRRSPTDTVVDWIEYVVETDGAHHLK